MRSAARRPRRRVSGLGPGVLLTGAQILSTHPAQDDVVVASGLSAGTVEKLQVNSIELANDSNDTLIYHFEDSCSAAPSSIISNSGGKDTLDSSTIHNIIIFKTSR